MKIVIVNAVDIWGGAAKAAYRLHRALLENGVESRMLVQKKFSDDCTVIKPSAEPGILETAKRLFRKIQAKFFNPLKKYPKKRQAVFSPAYLEFSGMVDEINAMNPDIVHLHWIGGEMLKIEELGKIEAPIVWSLHDMWAFTGGCHYDDGCGRYTEICGQCKVLQSSIESDLSRQVFWRKKKTYAQIKNMTVVGLSKWLNRCAESSTLLRDKKHFCLPNPIDTNQFKPFEKRAARALWKLPQEKKLVLFGAASAVSDPRKGFDKLRESIRYLHHKEDMELVVFGSGEPEEPQNFGCKTHYLGHLHDDVSLVALYSAVDVMVVPSLQENLSNAIMESLACATPVVAFDIGGNGDMIEHGKSGYLAVPFDSKDLARGIEWVIDCEYYDDLCRQARSNIIENFDSALVARKYIGIYKEILNG